MSATKVTGKTIGEVERLTGIPKRKLKYFIEQNLMQPSQRAKNGYWLYSDEDVRRAQIISLCRELGCPDQTTRAILKNPGLYWKTALERQIVILNARRDHTECQLLLAEYLLHSSSADGPDFSKLDLTVSGRIRRDSGTLIWATK